MQVTIERVSFAEAGAYLGLVACERGNFTAAAHLCREARHQARRIGLRAVEAIAALAQVRVILRGTPSRSRLRAAAMLLEHGRTLATTRGLAQPLLQATLLTAELHLCRGAVPQAQAAAAEALRLSTESGRQREEALARRLLGQCALAGRDVATAETQLRSAVDLLTAGEMALEAARTRRVLARALIAGSQGEAGPAEARALLAAARAGFVACGAALDLAQAE
jgi:hypothetical protein